MSTRLFVYCDVSNANGTCPQRMISNAATPAEATAIAISNGWTAPRLGGHVCPDHSRALLPTAHRKAPRT
jgi:hypothetical protein